jgi:hypothetical protein
LKLDKRLNQLKGPKRLKRKYKESSGAKFGMQYFILFLQAQQDQIESRLAFASAFAFFAIELPRLSSRGTKILPAARRLQLQFQY